MKKIYYKLLLIAFSAAFIAIVTFFYIGYLKREEIKKERLRLAEISEIFSLIKDNYPLDQSKIPLLKEIEKSYGVYLSVKTKQGFNYSTDGKIFSPSTRSRLIPIKRPKKIRRNLSPIPFRLNRKMLPNIDIHRDKITYFIDGKTKILRGIKIKNPEMEIFILKKSNVFFVAAFFTLISVLFVLSAIIFYLIRKWYVNPLINLEMSIKSIESNLNSPELYQDLTGTLTPVFNALNDLKKRIVQEINSKEEMLRDISHDLKTPLSRIKLATEFIENEKIKKGIKEDVKELEDLISKILDIYTVKKKDCKYSLYDFLNEMTEKYPAVNFKIICNKDIYIPVCGEDLKRIFYNLVDNSIKFSTVSKGIFIEVKSKENSITIKYKDCGTKGEKPDLERIFDYFYKKDKARNKNLNNGFGLGLSIVKKICEQYEGRVSANFSDCDGIEFTLEFPLN